MMMMCVYICTHRPNALWPWAMKDDKTKTRTKNSVISHQQSFNDDCGVDQHGRPSSGSPNTAELHHTLKTPFFLFLHHERQMVKNQVFILNIYYQCYLKYLKSNSSLLLSQALLGLCAFDIFFPGENLC